jgi:hypothetical protein
MFAVKFLSSYIPSHKLVWIFIFMFQVIKVFTIINKNKYILHTIQFYTPFYITSLLKNHVIIHSLLKKLQLFNYNDFLLHKVLNFIFLPKFNVLLEVWLKPGAQPTEGKGRERIGREGKEIAQFKQIQQYTTHGSLRNDPVVNGYI